MERVPFMVLKVEEGLMESGRKKQTHPLRPLHGFHFPRLPWHFVLTSLLHCSLQPLSIPVLNVVACQDDTA